jgi:hypothetical protein
MKPVETPYACINGVPSDMVDIVMLLPDAWDGWGGAGRMIIMLLLAQKRVACWNDTLSYTLFFL